MPRRPAAPRAFDSSTDLRPEAHCSTADASGSSLRPRANAASVSIVPLCLALALNAGPASADGYADDQNHQGLAVEWLYPTVGGCGSSVLGDFDGDGDIDLALAEGDSQSVSLWWNDGRARFDARGELVVGHPFGEIFAFDADRDGMPDLVVTDRRPDGGLEVFQGLRDGRFAAPVRSGAGVPFGAMASGDMNGDGLPDLVAIGGGTTKAVHVLLNRGAMAFEATTVLPIWPSASAIAAGDFDGDRRLDIACNDVPGDSLGIHVFRGDGHGGLSHLIWFYRGNGVIRELLAVDCDGDGDLDLLSADDFMGVGVHLNEGAGTFVSNMQEFHGARGTAIGVGDLDVDSRPELVVSSGSANYGVAFRVFDVAGDPTLEAGARYSYARTSNGAHRDEPPSRVLAADLDGDGRSDLVFITRSTRYLYPSSSGPGEVGIVTTRATGRPAAIGFHAALTSSGVRVAPIGVRAAAFGRGPSELLIFGPEGTSRTRVLAGGSLDELADLSAAVEAWPVDLDRDGRDDLVLRFGDDTLAVALTERSGTLGPELVRWAGRWIGARDLTGDHRPEIVFMRPDRTIAVMWNAPRHPFMRTTSTDLTVPEWRSSATLAEPSRGPGSRLILLKLDQKSYAEHEVDTIEVHHLLRDGRTMLESTSLVNTGIESWMSLGDFVAADMDGVPGDELLVQGVGAGWNGAVLAVFHASANGGYEAEPTVYAWSPGESSSRLLVADVDGDGDQDVGSVGNWEGMVGQLSLLWNRGDGSFDEERWKTVLAEFNPRSAAAGDFDGDGAMDIAVAGRTGPGVGAARPGELALLYGESSSGHKVAGRGRKAPRLEVLPAPGAFGLRAAFPNPVQSRLTVRFALGGRDPAALELYDLAGRRVHTEQVADPAPGERTLAFEMPRGLSAGVYWLALRQGSGFAAARITVMR